VSSVLGEVHTLIWRYIKDSSDAAEADAAWVDNVQWQPEQVKYAVNVNLTGNGAGTVESNLTGITCGAICSADFVENASIILTATPTQDSVFAGWEGCPDINDNKCQLAVQSPITVSAEFQLQVYDVVTTVGTGGTLVSGSTTVEHGTSVVFELLPEPGYRVSIIVGGSCPSGRWLTATRYETGEAKGACNVSFSFKPVSAKKRKLPFWIFSQSS